MLRTLATWVKPWRTLSSGRCPERASPRKLFRAVVQVITARLPGLEQVVEALLLGGPWLGRPRWPRTPWREQSRTEGCFKETGVARAVQGRLVQRGCPALGRAEGGPWSEGEPGWVGLAESLSLRDAEWPGQAPAHTLQVLGWWICCGHVKDLIHKCFTHNTIRRNTRCFHSTSRTILCLLQTNVCNVLTDCNLLFCDVGNCRTC